MISRRLTSVMALSTFFVGIVLGQGGCVIDDGGIEVESLSPEPQLDGCTDLGDPEPNDSPGDATVLSSLEGETCGEISPSDLDHYRFTVPSSYTECKLSIEVEDAGGNCFFYADPYLELLSSDGSSVLYEVEDDFLDYCPRLSIRPTSGTDYLLRVGTRTGLSGEYLLTIARGGEGSISGTVSQSQVAERQRLRQESYRAMENASVTQEPPIPDAMPYELLLFPRPGVSLNDLEAQLRMRLRALARGPALAREGGGKLPMADGMNSPEVHLEPRLGGRLVLARIDGDQTRSRRARIETTQRMLEQIRTLPAVAEAQLNHRLEPLLLPADDYFSLQWDLGDLPGMNMRDAWDISTGSASVVVAIVDTGHDPLHPDLRDKAVAGFDFVSSSSYSGDGDGIDSDPSNQDGDIHGTHVAGTVAASTNNDLGVSGVGWNVRYMPLRVCGGDVGCTEADIAEAIWHAIGYQTAAGEGLSEPRAQVINISLGGHDRCSPALQTVIDAAVARNVIVTVSAGNSNDDASAYSPASCAGVIAVGSSNQSAERSEFSNYGPAVAIMAPGESILSTIDGADYAYLNGTSMASPHIAGLAALLKSLQPGFSFDLVHELIAEGAGLLRCDRGEGQCGAGLVDAGATLELGQQRADEAEAIEGPIAVAAVDSTSSSRQIYALVDGGHFSLEDVPMGTWRILVGVDLNSDRRLDPEHDEVVEAASPVQISTCGEDITGISLVLE